MSLKISQLNTLNEVSVTALFTNPLVPCFTAFEWYYSCEGKNGHILSMGERPMGTVASGGMPAAGLVNSAVTLGPIWHVWRTTLRAEVRV